MCNGCCNNWVTGPVLNDLKGKPNSRCKGSLGTGVMAVF